METVRVRRTDFIAVVTTNRDAHRSVFLKAVDGYRDRWIHELEVRLADIRRGGQVDQYFRLPEPEDHTDDYDRILKMAEMSVDEELEFSEDEFARYVMDQWSWKREFARTTAEYVGRRVARRS